MTRTLPTWIAQTVVIPTDSLGGGYDARIAGPNPWTLGPLGPQAAGYLKGQSANAADVAGVKAVGGVLHAYTDSSQSAAEMVSGVKSYNNGLNVTDDGRLVTTLFHELQDQGWKLGHGHERAIRSRLARRDVCQERRSRRLPGPCPGDARAPGGHPAGARGSDSGRARRGHGDGLRDHEPGGVPGRTGEELDSRECLHRRPRPRGDRRQERREIRGRPYPVVDRRRLALRDGAVEAARRSSRLFGFFGRTGLDHLPYRTADGRYDPAPSIGRKGEPVEAEVYTPADRIEQPTLAQMTEAALTVLAARPDQPFALFVEAGDVDFALHANNLDNAVGAVYSGEEAIRTVIRWVETHSNWDESLVIVSSDHGHYLVVDDPKALAGAR